MARRPKLVPDDCEAKGPPDVAQMRRWLEAMDGHPVQYIGPDECPTGVAMWLPSHLQTAEIVQAHGMPWLVLQTTFCAGPRRKVAVMPLVAHANLQMEGGRWFRLERPQRLVCAYEVPAQRLDAAEFATAWERFRREVLTHGVELTLRTRAEPWLTVLAKKGFVPPRRPRRRSTANSAEGRVSG
ncbi:MAG: hypothetical protein FJ100_14745 [Deltaproteobacteria bacterium]|nr:hypothetical protein [Deltaproteobacteria bacterium]